MDPSHPTGETLSNLASDFFDTRAEGITKHLRRRYEFKL